MSGVYKTGDRVRIVRVNWDDPTPEDISLIGREGTVRDVSFAVKVQLDEVPDGYSKLSAMAGGLLFINDELELIK